VIKVSTTLITWALFSSRSSSSELYVPLCTIPAGVFRRGMGQDPVILPGGDPDAGMLGRDPWH